MQISQIQLSSLNDGSSVERVPINQTQNTVVVVCEPHYPLQQKQPYTPQRTFMRILAILK
jgi:hypothetical protein